MFGNVYHEYEGLSKASPKVNKHPLAQAIETGYVDTDADMKEYARSLPQKPGLIAKGGTTACTIWIHNNTLFCGNVGDSRCIVSRGCKAEEVTCDHKPVNARERFRILQAGGKVYKRRVQGILGVSRTLGDFRFKKDADKAPCDQMVSSVPDVVKINVTPSLDFFVLASDGIFDVISNQGVVDFILGQLKRQKQLDDISLSLIAEVGVIFSKNASLKMCKSLDNMTVIIGVLR